jgi:hypothetical protein
LASSSAEKTVLPITLISRTKTRKDGNGPVSGGIGAEGSSVPGGGVGASNCFGRGGGSPERPVGSTRGTTWALADEKMKKIKHSAKDQNTVTASVQNGTTEIQHFRHDDTISLAGEIKGKGGAYGFTLALSR